VPDSVTSADMQAILKQNPVKLPAELEPFAMPQCDITKFRDATKLIDSGFPVDRIIPQLTDKAVDYNKDGARLSSNQEWAAAMIATAQVVRKYNLSLDDIPANRLQEIIEKGRDHYDEFKKKAQRADAKCSIEGSLGR